MTKTWKYKSLKADERPPSSAAAQAFINEIRTSWGLYDEADELEWSKVPERLREQHELLREQRQENVKGHTSLAAQGLYTTKFRFIHEVIQNADDAKYGKTVPHLSITMLRDKIVFKTNENGFVAKDVAALCNIGQSSKAGDHATTGEKGLGFKSVFGVANHIHIESGHWSFSFHHSEGDDGIGMVIPTWVGNPDNQAFTKGTKLTLEYATPTTDFKANLRTALLNITQDFFLALRNLQKISIVVKDAGSANCTRIFTRLPTSNDRTIQIHSATDTRESITQFLVFKTLLTGMPTSPLRPRDSTEIMIAFQVGEDGHPDVASKGHYAYATLPIRRITGLRFIVQADFTLLPSRENLNDSHWNQRILSELPNVFASAVDTLNKHDVLKYEWLQFLPGSLDGAEDCWQHVRRDMLKALGQRPTVESKLTAKLQYPKDIRLIPTSFIHDSSPLFKDLPGTDIYISDRYDVSLFGLLEEIGVEKLTADEMLARISADAKSGSPRLRQSPLRHGWHTTFLQLVDDLCNVQRLRHSLHSLDIIPLSTGQWCSPQSQGKICLPHVELDGGRRTQLPGNLKLRKLSPEACGQDATLERLYGRLGVKRCTPTEAVSEIIKVHQSSLNRTNATLSAGCNQGSVSDWLLHYEILFWQGYPTPAHDLMTLMCIDNQHNVRVANHLYFQSKSPYSAFMLLKDAVTPGRPEFSRYGFLHTEYDKSEMHESIRHGSSWMAWLEKTAGIRHHPPLLQTTPNVRHSDRELHSHLTYIALHRSSDFVSMLHAHWHTSYRSSYGPKYKTVAEMISETWVPTTNGVNIELQKSFLPTEAILALAKKYGVDKYLPLLALPQKITVAEEHTWMFLQQFGVSCKVDKLLVVEILKCLQRTKHAEDTLEQHCLEIYGKLVTLCTVDDKKWLKDVLDAHYGILVPTCAGDLAGSPWVALRECVWNGPPSLISKTVLQKRYENNTIAKQFFLDLLALPNATSEDVLQDLTKYSEENDGSESSLDKCKELYKTLRSRIGNGADLKAIKSKFQQSKLIYASGRWHTSSVCIWNGSISTRQSLEAFYPDLRSFFVDQLGVVVVATNLILTELLEAGTKGSANKDEFRDLIIALSETLSTPADRELIMDNMKRLRTLSFLPLRDSSIPLAKIGHDFVIVDSQRFGNAFEGRLPALDFTLEQLMTVGPVLQLLNLEDRYLSKIVKTRFHVSDQQMEENLTEHVRHRAYALSSCAVAYQSPRYLNQNKLVYNMISHCDVYTCGQLNTQLVVVQNGKEVSIPDDRPTIDLQEENGKLSIFVPHDANALTSCIQTELPKRLMQFLGIQASQAERQLYRILCEDDEKLDEVLKQEDLPDVDWLAPPEPKLRVIPATSSDYDANEDADPDDHTERATVTLSNHPDHPVVFENTNLLRTTLVDNSYETFLTKIIIPQARQHIVDSGAHSACRLADMSIEKIGAAGELFFFEYLNSLNLPDFSADNWKSDIRHLVNVVPEYNFPIWGVDEVADFEYVDTSGDFARFLGLEDPEIYSEQDISQDLSAQFQRVSLEDDESAELSSSDLSASDSGQESSNDRESSQEPIKYLIEVKSTVGRCDLPFHVSPNQYDHMTHYQIEPEVPPHTVYVIIRVYNLLSTDIKFKVFVDPVTLAENGTLYFTPDHWTVRQSAN